MTGRVVTAQLMPLRKDFDNYVQAQAKIEGTKTTCDKLCANY